MNDDIPELDEEFDEDDDPPRGLWVTTPAGAVGVAEGIDPIDYVRDAARRLAEAEQDFTARCAAAHHLGASLRAIAEAAQGGSGGRPVAGGLTHPSIAGRLKRAGVKIRRTQD